MCTSGKSSLVALFLTSNAPCADILESAYRTESKASNQSVFEHTRHEHVTNKAFVLDIAGKNPLVFLFPSFMDTLYIKTQD